MSRAKHAAINTLKDTLVSRFGSEFRDLVSSEVDSRLTGKSKLEREDLDCIERSIVNARKQRRGVAPGATKSRSSPNLSALAAAPEAFVPTPPLQLGSPTAPRTGSGGSQEGRAAAAASLLMRSASAADTTQSSMASFNPKKVRRPAPYGTSIMPDDDNMSERSRVKVNPRFPVPLRPKLKPMDHWDLIVAFDTLKHRQEDAHFRGVAKHQQQEKFKKRLDDQMCEFRQLQAEEDRAKQREREDMLAQIEENKRIAQAERDYHERQKDRMKEVNNEGKKSIERRRKAEEDRKQREQDCMLKWLADEEQRARDQKAADAEEFARKCKKAKDEMEEALREAQRKKEARQAEEKAFATGAQQAADDAEAANRAAVQARMDQIERNCQTVGAEIAGRDARMEAELQAKIKRVQEEADRAAKEDADRRKSSHDKRVKDMIETLGKQVKQREEEAEVEKEAGRKQAMVFKQEYEEGLAKDKAKEERARQARADLDVHLIDTIRKNAVVHPRDFGAQLTKKQELAYNRGLFEQMAVEGFAMSYTSKFLPEASHTGKLDPFPSVGPYEGEIHALERQQPDVS
eukprot:TRINITY_DN42633_c0_g1_i1.p1 TRINITY_DN42633_c0_g1~~TRINITY_DN42633_c0_g1_i1.p1  ORF type:complete len:591 (+),score=173.06 TRINITY_DN42633_c0_g1_i1:54-1775(+)